MKTFKNLILMDSRQKKMVFWAAVLFIIAFLRLPAFLTPFFNGDESIYSIVAHTINHQGVLYHDVVDHKPPLIYFTYALIYFFCGGMQIWAVKILTILVLFLSCFLLYRITLELFNPRTAYLSALIYGIYANCGIGKDFLAANTEIFANLFVLAGFFSFSRKKFGLSPFYLFASGFFIGISLLYRFPSGIYILVPGILILVISRVSLKTVFQLFMTGLGFIIPSVFFFAYYYFSPYWDDFYFWLLKYNFFYIQQGTQLIQSLKNLAQGLYPVLISQLPVFILFVMGLKNFIKEKKWKQTSYLFVFVYFFASLIGYSAGTRFTVHYFLQVIPAVIILSSIGLEIWLQSNPQVLKKLQAKIFLLIAILIPLLFLSISYYIVKHPVPIKINYEQDYREISQYIHKNTHPEERILVWGFSPEIYYYADRLPGTRFIFTNYQAGRIWGTKYANNKNATPLTNKAAEVKEAWEWLISDIQVKKPKMIVDTGKSNVDGFTNFTIDQYLEFYQMISNFYAYKTEIKGFRVYELK